MKYYWITTYVTYLLLTLPSMIWVGRTLRQNGQLFLMSVFNGDQELAHAINHLLVSHDIYNGGLAQSI